MNIYIYRLFISIYKLYDFTNIVIIYKYNEYILMLSNLDDEYDENNDVSTTINM